MEGKLVVLEFFSNETEAAIARGFLEANGINAYIFNNSPDYQRMSEHGPVRCSRRKEIRLYKDTAVLLNCTMIKRTEEIEKKGF